MSKDIAKRFESLSEFHAYIENGEVQPDFKGYESSQREGDGSWAGTCTFSDAEKLLLYGDVESADKVNADGVHELRKNIKRHMQRRTIYTSPVGFAPHVPNFLAGTPNSMINQKTIKQPKKVLTVVYSSTAHSGVSAQTISDTAARVFSALLILEAKGMQINMYSAVTAVKKSQRVGMFIKIKRAGQRFDILRMCYPCINTSWLRRHYFRFVEVTKGVKSAYVCSYGCVCGMKDTEELAHLAKIDADAVLTFEQCRDMTVDEILKTITK